MANFKKSITTTGKFKMIAVENGIFVDTETGEQIQIAEILEDVYGSGQPFDLSVTQKSDDDITPNVEG